MGTCLREFKYRGGLDYPQNPLQDARWPDSLAFSRYAPGNRLGTTILAV